MDQQPIETETIGMLHHVVMRETYKGRRLVQLMRPFVYRLRIGGFRFSVVVPKGFISDLTSIPRLLWWLLPPDGPYQEAAVVHDYLYSLPEVPRWICDAMFRHVMQAMDVPLRKRVPLFYGVRIGGWACRKPPCPTEVKT